MMTLAIIGMAIGALGGIANAAASSIEYSEKKKDLQLARDNVTASYDQAVAHANASAKESIDNLNANIANRRIGRDASLGSGAQGLVDQQQVAQQQIAELQVQAAEATGAAEQSLATSGVRRRTDAEGNTMNAVVQNTSKKSARSIALAETQAKIQLQQGFREATMAYTDANMSIDSYQRQIQYTRNELDRTLANYKLEYDQQIGAIDRDLDYMNGTGQWVLGLQQFSGILGGAASGFSRGMSFSSSWDTFRANHPVEAEATTA